MASEAFRGEFYQKVDAKARVSIPAAFRRILDARGFIASSKIGQAGHYVFERAFVEK